VGRLSGKRPSPATLLSIIAIVLAVTGTAAAGVATISSLDKQEKKQTRKIAQSEIAKAAPGLSVASATKAGTADTVPNGSLGTAKFASSIPAVHVTRTDDQTIPADTDTAIEYDSERYDTAGLHDNATNNTRLTAPVAGIYQVTAQINWETVLAPRELLVRMNGSTQIAKTRDAVVDQSAQTVTTQVRLEAGDYLETLVFQETGGPSVDIDKTQEYSPEFSMTWIAPGP
jgi:hypothetical protein